MLFKKGFLLYCDIWGKDCRGENYLEGHIRAVHEGIVPTVLFVLLLAKSTSSDLLLDSVVTSVRTYVRYQLFKVKWP